MPKSKLEQSFNNKSGDTSPSSKANNLTPAEVDVLLEQIKSLEAKITTLQIEIQVSQKQIAESSEALQLVKTPPKWEPSPGQFQLFDELKAVVDQAKDEQGRFEKLHQIEQAIARGRDTVQQRQREVSDLELQLEALREELDWQQNYLPHLLEFERAYQMPARQVEKIRKVGARIHESRVKISELQEVAKKSPDDLARWKRNNPGYAAIEQVIADNQAQILQYEQDLEAAKVLDQADFRAFIRARVAIEPALQTLIQQQQKYFCALKEFANVLVGIPGLRLQDGFTKESLPGYVSHKHQHIVYDHGMVVDELLNFKLPIAEVKPDQSILLEFRQLSKT